MFKSGVFVLVLCAVIVAHEHKLTELRELDSTEIISPDAAVEESAKQEESQLHYIKSILSLLNKFKAIKDQKGADDDLNAGPKDIEDESDLDKRTHDANAHEASDNVGITNDKSRQLDLIDYFTGEWYDNLKNEQHSEEKERGGTRRLDIEENERKGTRRLDIELNEDDFSYDVDDIDNPPFYDDVDINGGFIPRRFMGDTMLEMKGRTGMKTGDRISDTSPQLQSERRFLFSPLGIRGLYLNPGIYQHAAPTNTRPFTFSNLNSRDILTFNQEVKQPISQLQPSDLVQPSYLQPRGFSQPSGLLKPSLNFLSKYRRHESGDVGASTEAEITSYEKDDNAYPFEPNQRISDYLKKRLRS